MMKPGKGYLGSSRVETSTGNQEIIPSPPANWSNGYRLYKLSFKAYDDMNVIINKNSNIFLKAGQTFEIDRMDALINSFVVVDEDVQFQWIGAY